ncbi:MAG TPA: Wadjet anti-phage system protein JetD domain-containing protein [Variovorax sp.]|nr:Wadjet anti-phage system protein JetD domain-containing protein [Variovorax sp.]
MAAWANSDVSLDAASFAALRLPVRQVFITENETNFLAFPALEHAIVIFGAGYGWEALDRATLLAHEIHWGEEPDPVRNDLPRLGIDEQTLFNDLRGGWIRPRLRLEQARVGYGWFLERLALNRP